MTNKNISASIIRVLAMLFIVLGHIFSLYISNNYRIAIFYFCFNKSLFNIFIFHNNDTI